MRIIKRNCSFLKAQFSFQKGFTLVEMLIYMGILTMIITALSVLLGEILNVQLDAQSTSGVDQDSRYIQGRMTYDMQRASSITTPSLGTPSSTLQIVINSVNYTYSIDGSGNLVLTDGTGTNQLNSGDTTISGVSFERIGDGDDNDTVRVTYTVTSDIQETSGQEARTVQTTLGLQ